MLLTVRLLRGVFHFTPLILKLFFILPSSLLQDSTASASEDSNSLFTDVCPCTWHFNKNTPLSLRLCLTRCLSGLSPSYGSCCLWSVLLCCRSRPPQSPTRMTASRYLLVKAVLLKWRQALMRPENQSLLNKRGRPGLKKGLQWKGVWTRYTETSPVCAELWECKKSFSVLVIFIFLSIYVL